jgi:hypothetical protein
MPSFEIPDNAVRIELTRGGTPADPLTGKAAYTITNRGQALGGRLSVQVKGGAKPEWFTIQDGKERTFAAGETQTVQVAIAVPAATPAGEYGFRLRIVSVVDTDNDHTESAASTMVVPHGGTPPAPSFPWWIVVVVLIVLAAIVAFVVTAFVTPGFLLDRAKPVPSTEAAQPVEAEVPVATNCRVTYAADGGLRRRFLMDGPPLDRLRSGDFDGDGVADLFTAVPDGKGSYQWLYASGGKAPFKPLGTGPDLPGLHFGDFDGDGITDVLFQKAGSGEEFDWLLSSGGTKAPAHLRYGRDLATIGIGDFDGDGTADLLGDLVRPDGLYQWVMYKSGRGDPQPLAYAQSMSALRFADFDKDGKADVFSDSTEGGVTRWLISRGASTNYVSLAGPLPPLSTIALADVDGDNATDLIAGEPVGNGQFKWVYWTVNWLGDTGSVTKHADLGTGPDPAMLIFGNFDGNAKADFVMADCK